RRVLDLLQGDDVRVQGVDRRDDLVLLALQVGLVPGATGVAAAGDRERVAVPVGVGGAAAQVLPEGGEVVQHVERGQLQVAAHVLRGGVRLAGVAPFERHQLVGVPGHRGGGLEVPAEPVVHDHRFAERHAHTGAQVRCTGEVGHLSIGAGAGGLPVVQGDGAGGVVRHHRVVLRSAGGRDVGRADQRAVQAEADRAEGVRAPAAEIIGVGDDVVAGRGDQHALVHLPLGVGGGQLEIGHGDHRVGRLVQHGQVTGVHAELGEVVVLRHIAGDLDEVTRGDVVHGRRGVHEHGLGGGVGLLATGTGGLDVVAVEPAGGVDRSHHSAGGHQLVRVDRGLGALALDVGDGQLDTLGVIAVISAV